jgi:hypothetical protein
MDSSFFVQFGHLGSSCHADLQGSMIEVFPPLIAERNNITVVAL